MTAKKVLGWAALAALALIPLRLAMDYIPSLREPPEVSVAEEPPAPEPPPVVAAPPPVAEIPPSLPAPQAEPTPAPVAPTAPPVVGRLEQRRGGPRGPVARPAPPATQAEPARVTPLEEKRPQSPVTIEAPLFEVGPPVTPQTKEAVRPTLSTDLPLSVASSAGAVGPTAAGKRYPLQSSTFFARAAGIGSRGGWGDSCIAELQFGAGAACDLGVLPTQVAAPTPGPPTPGPPNVIPLPGALWLFLSGLLPLVWLRRRAR